MSVSRLLAWVLAASVAAGGGLAPGRWAPSRGDVEPSAATSFAASPAPQDIESLNAPYDGRLHFVRIRYTPYGGRDFGGRRWGGREPMWAHDYPRGERNFMKIIDEVTLIHPLVDGSNILTFDDPRLFQYPIAYIVEVGAWAPTDAEVEGLREYLLKGGFLIIDDFRDYRSLANLTDQMDRVLPGIRFVELDETHEIFDSFFRIDPHAVIPPYGPQTPVWYGLFEDNDPGKRMMVIVNYDNDISEYWEFSDMGYYPIDLSNEAYKLGVNYLVYALTH